MEAGLKPSLKCTKNGAAFKFFFRLSAGLDAEQSQGNFSRVQQVAALFAVEDAPEHGIGGAGNEIADIFAPGQWRHGVAKGDRALLASKAVVAIGGWCEPGIAGVDRGQGVGAVPGLEAALDGIVPWGRAESFDSGEFSGRGEFDGFEEIARLDKIAEFDDGEGGRGGIGWLDHDGLPHCELAL